MTEMTNFLEVRLKCEEDFLKVRETLTRIGVASKKDKVLYQSCHILHKQGKYAILHFKELFILDGKDNTLTEEDIQRRLAIANLLEEWKLCINARPRENVVDIQMEKNSCEKYAKFLSNALAFGTELDIAEACHQFEYRLKNLKQNIIVEVLKNGSI